MQSHDIVKELLKHTTTKHVAQELGVSLSLVYKWAEAPIEGSGTSNPLDRIEMLMRLSGDLSPLEWLCARFDGVFVERAAGEMNIENLVPCISGVLIELGSLLAKLPCPEVGGEAVSSTDVERIRMRWTQTKFVIDSFLSTAGQRRCSETGAPDEERVANDRNSARRITPVRYKRSLGSG